MCWRAPTGDARSPACADEGFNLEIEFELAPGETFPEDSVVLAECQLSQDEAIDCPDLP